MIKMSYNDAKDTISVILKSKLVPMIYGHAGIGKSQLAKDIVNDYNEQGIPCKLEIIYGSVLGEKELGGIPIRVTREFKPKGSDEGIKIPVNEYTTHETFVRILENDQNGIMTILFIDELNRCDRSVQNELMQLILDRRINQFKLPKSCLVMAAGNLESDDTMDYQTTTMNDALKDRFWQAEMTSNLNEWLVWATKTNDKTNITNIDDDIVEFLTEYTELFHITDGESDIKPNPRSWHMLSKEKRALEGDKGVEHSQNALYFLAAGHVGDIVANKFVNFMINKKNPMIKPVEFFNSSEDEFEKLLHKFKSEAIPRIVVIMNRTIKFVSEYFENSNNKSAADKKQIEKFKDRFVKIIEQLPKDFMVGVFQNIGHNYKGLHDKMVSYEPYIDLYFKTNQRVMSIK